MNTTKTAAEAANGAQMRAVLDEKVETLSFMDKVKAAPRRLRNWLRETATALKLDGPANAVADAARWAWDKVLYALGFVRKLGVSNVIGAVITAKPARDAVVKAAAWTARQVAKPFGWLARGLKWAFGKVGFKAGVSAVETVERKVADAATWVAGKVADGQAWFDTRESHDWMRALRGYFQGALVMRMVSMAFPTWPYWSRLLVSAIVPTFADQQAVAAEEAAIKKAKEVLAKDLTAQVKDAKQAEQTGTFMKKEVVILTDTDRPENDRTFEAVMFTDDNGERYVRLGKQLKHVDDLDATVSLVGAVKGDAEPVITHDGVTTTVTAEQPPMSRAARRAQQRSHKNGAAQKA